MPEHIDHLKKAIEGVIGCCCRHYGTEYVKEEEAGEILWEGFVEVFEIDDYSEASMIYGWTVMDNQCKTHYIGIPKTPLVDSPLAAVRAALASECYPVENRSNAPTTLKAILH